jgi:hypothetical protein
LGLALAQPEFGRALINIRNSDPTVDSLFRRHTSLMIAGWVILTILLIAALASWANFR